MEGFNITHFFYHNVSGGYDDVVPCTRINALINYVVINYFAHFFAVCFIRAKVDTVYHTAPIATIVLELDDNFENAFGVAVDKGCQSFIVTERTADAFFDAFLPVHEAAFQRSMEKRILVVLDSNSSVFPTISRQLVIEVSTRPVVLPGPKCIVAASLSETYLEQPSAASCMIAVKNSFKVSGGNSSSSSSSASCGWFSIPSSVKVSVALSPVDHLSPSSTGSSSRQHSDHGSKTAFIHSPEIPEMLIVLPTSPSPCATFELYTPDISDGTPVTIVPRLLDVIDTRNGTVPHNTTKDINYFPDKFVNMNKRRLRLGTIEYLPNSFVEDKPLGEGNARYILPPKPNVSAMVGGTELWLVTLFCEIANCTTEVMIAPEWGNVYDNGTKIGLIGAPAKREVDITLAGLYTWYSSFQHLAFTAIHSRSGCTCIVAKPRIIANWRTPFLSFTGTLWAAVLAAFVTGTFAIMAMSRSRHRILQLNDAAARYTFSDSVLIMIGFFMEQGVTMPNDLLASCLLFTTLMFAGFMIGSSYNGGLASTMIVPQYENSINTVHDLAETRTTWVGVSVSWIYSIQLAYQPDMLTLLQTFREWEEGEIFRRAYDRDVAIIVERMEYGHFAHPAMELDAMKGRKMMAEDIYWESVVGMCSKTWPARARYDRLVLQLKATGILAHWELIGVAKYLTFKSQQVIRYSRESAGDEFTPLRMANITGALLILVVGLSLSVVVFLVELVWYRWVTRRKL